MNNNLKIKINGFSLKSLFLALYLSKDKNNQIYIYDHIIQNKACDLEEKFYTITNSTKLVLEELKLWKELQKKCFCVKSFSFYNNSLKEEILLKSNDLYIKDELIENIGWTIKHSDIEELLKVQLSNYKNIHFLKNNSSNFIKKFDYIFNFEEFNRKILKFDRFRYLNYSFKASSIVFKIMVSGDFEERAFEIFQNKESILMIPISKNIYQIIWKANLLKSKDRMNLNVNLLLDNLSTLLPYGLRIDQIVGDIKFSPNSLSISNIIKIHDNQFYFNNFNEISNHIIRDELKSLFIDLNLLQKILIANNTFYKKFFLSFKYIFYLKKLLNSLSQTPLKCLSLKFLIGFNLFPDLFINIPLMKLNNQNIIKKFFIKIIFKSTFLNLIK